MIFGISIDKNNPAFTIEQFKFWMPKFSAYADSEDGLTAFSTFYPIVNARIFKSIFGSDWEYAMALGIAHFMTLRGKQMSATNDGTAAGVAGNDNYGFILSGVSVGSFSKSFDTASTLVDGDEAKFWNLTSYGAILMALYKMKSPPSIFVVTPTNPPFDPIGDYYRRHSGNYDVIMREKVRRLEEEMKNKQEKGDYVISKEKEED